ncbi:MAG: tetratricopeptide repeat protein [Dokdonella sp.]|uniref:tetratricopeptide repeat protein n=1 Tax=Dokdonella sp. TaxID=2291710 RepID=UPI003262D379
MTLRIFSIITLAAVFAASSPIVRAEAEVKAVPMPDLSHLPPDRAENVRKARTDFDEVRKAQVGDELATTYAFIGAVYAQNELYSAASVALDDAIVLAPTDGRWVYSRGIVARIENQPAVAKALFERALTLDLEYVPIRLAAADARVQAGDLEGARSLLSDYAAKHDNEASVFAMLGDIALRQKRYADAIEQTNKALKADPQANQLFAQLAKAYAGAGNDKAAAEANAKAGPRTPALADPLAQALRGGPAAASAPTSPLENAVNQAAVLLSARKYDGARMQMDQALALKPNDSSLLAFYSRIEAAAGNLPAAKVRAASAIAADPKNPLAHLSNATALEIGGDDAGAKREYLEAIGLDGKLVDARSQLALLLMRTGHNTDAIAQFRAIIQAEPGNGEAWTRLVVAQVAEGQCAGVLKDVNAGLGKMPNARFLLQLFIRLTSTCGGSGADEKRMALDYAAKLYRTGDQPQLGETYALALAANGKWDDAVKTQEAAMFVVLRNGMKPLLPAYREWLAQFRSHKLPDKPWPSTSAIYLPKRPGADLQPTQTGTPPGKK